MNFIVSGAVVATFPLQLTPAALILDKALGLRAHRDVPARMLNRVVLVSACGAVVVLVRDLSELISLV